MAFDNFAQNDMGVRDSIFDTITEAAFQSSLPPFWDDRVESEVNQAIKTAFEKPQNPYIEVKKKLQILGDLKNGVYSQDITKKDETTGKEVRFRLRDTRFQPEGHAVNDTRENWTIIGLTYFQVAEQMLSNEHGTAAVHDFREKAATFIDLMQKSDNPKKLAEKTSEMIADMLSATLNLSKEDVHKKMGKLKDLCNMDDEPESLVTLQRHYDMEGKAVDVAEIDAPLYQLTDEQKQDYVRILQSNNEPVSDITLPLWFQGLKNEETKKMVRYYAGELLSETGRLIPTQMLNVMPGLRNAREARVYAKNVEDKEAQPEKIYQSFYAGNIAHDVHVSKSETSPREGFSAAEEENIRLTMMSMRQMQALSGAKKLLINSWIAPIAGNEKRLHRCAEEAAKRLNQDNQQKNVEWKVVYANTSINAARIFGVWNERTVENDILQDAKEKLASYTGKSVEGIEALIQQARKENKKPLGISLENARNLIKNNPSFQDSSIQKSGLEAEIMAKLFQSLVAHEYIRSRTILEGSLLFGNQDNAQRAAHCNQMVDLMGDSDKNHGKAPERALLTGCKSGKDRAGFVAICSALVAVARRLTGYTPELSVIDLAKVKPKNDTVNHQSEDKKALAVLNHAAAEITSSAHVPKRAGYAGGSMGANGIKDSWYAQIIPSWMQDHELVQDEAKSNKGFKPIKIKPLDVILVVPAIVKLGIITKNIIIDAFTPVSEDEQAFLNSGSKITVAVPVSQDGIDERFSTSAVLGEENRLTEAQASYSEAVKVVVIDENSSAGIVSGLGGKTNGERPSQEKLDEVCLETDGEGIKPSVHLNHSVNLSQIREEIHKKVMQELSEVATIPKAKLISNGSGAARIFGSGNKLQNQNTEETGLKGDFKTSDVETDPGSTILGH